MRPITTLHLKAGDLLYSEGDRATDVYIIVSGKMAVYQGDQILGNAPNIRNPGDILGELAILTGLPRQVNTRAFTDATLFKIASSQIEHEFTLIDPLLRACIETSITYNQQLLGAQQFISDTRPQKLQAAQILEKIEFEVDLINSIEAGDFSMVYQPIVILDTAEVVGFEALMRWTHPVRGFVSPDIFIKAAERLGVIGTLTDFALVQSCQTLKKLEEQNGAKQRFFASVNISGHDIGRKGFADNLAFILDQNDIAPEQIKLEVTETAIIPKTQTVIDNLRAFRGLGCGLSIDDFGTGYSNLAYLKTLPLSTLKIDRAFSADAHKNRVSGSIVSMLLNLGADLNIDIIAEGVETSDDVQTLSDLGCRLAQGYYFYRPSTQDALLNLLSPNDDLTGAA